MNGEELVQKIEKTNNIKKLNRILKRIDFDRIDADTLAKIIEILKSKNGIYQSYHLFFGILLVLITTGILFGITNIITLLMSGAEEMSLRKGINSIYDMFTHNEDIFGDTNYTRRALNEFIYNIGFCLVASIGASVPTIRKNDIFCKRRPSFKHQSRYDEYLELLETIYKSKVEDLNTTLRKCEEEEIVIDNTLLVKLNRMVVDYIHQLPEDLREIYKNRLNDLLNSYYNKRKEYASIEKDAPAFVKDFQRVQFKDLIAGIKGLLEEIKPVIDKKNTSTLMTDFTNKLNQILEMESSTKRSEEFIVLTNLALDSFKNADVETFTTSLDLISEYFIKLISEDPTIATPLLYDINPFFYSCITDKIKRMLLDSDNLQAKMQISTIDGKKELYSPFAYAAEMIKLFNDTVATLNFPKNITLSQN